MHVFFMEYRNFEYLGPFNATQGHNANNNCLLWDSIVWIIKDKECLHCFYNICSIQFSNNTLCNCSLINEQISSVIRVSLRIFWHIIIETLKILSIELSSTCLPPLSLGIHPLHQTLAPTHWLDRYIQNSHICVVLNI